VVAVITITHESPKHDQSAQISLTTKLKASNLTQAPGGFTLIELLVAMILAGNHAFTGVHA